jgi:hypothetical protein
VPKVPSVDDAGADRKVKGARQSPGRTAGAR